MPSSDAISLLAVGDIMAGDTGLRFGFGSASTFFSRGLPAIRDRLRAVLGEADLVLGNLECPLADLDGPLQDYVGQQFLAPREIGRLLRESGFNVVNVANNHILQHGSEAYRDTVATLEGFGLGVVGDGPPEDPRPFRAVVRGHEVTVLGISMRPEVHGRERVPYTCVVEPERVVDVVRSCAPENGLYVVCLHWGAEFMGHPAPSQRRLAEGIFSAGAHLILGHHPHVLQPVEILDRGLVAYSLGNFVFDMAPARTRRSMVLRVRCSPDGGLVDASQIPVRIARDGWPEAAPAGEPQTVTRRPSAPGAMDAGRPDDSEDEYWVAASRAESRHALRNRLYFLSNLPRYGPRVASAALAHFVRRRRRPGPGNAEASR